MRVLVAITCLAVLAAIGYFFWSEYRASAEQQAAREALAHQAARAANTTAAEKLASAGRCTALAKALTNGQGKLSAEDLPDARLCYEFAALTAFERNSFDLYTDALK